MVANQRAILQDFFEMQMQFKQQWFELTSMWLMTSTMEVIHVADFVRRCGRKVRKKDTVIQFEDQQWNINSWKMFQYSLEQIQGHFKSLPIYTHRVVEGSQTMTIKPNKHPHI